MNPTRKSISTLLTIVVTVLLRLCEGEAVAQSEHAGRGGSGAVNSVYRIFCPDHDRAGTAFGHRSGKIITAEHIVHECDPKKLRVMAPSGTITGVTVVASDPELDLALLTPSIGDFVKVPLDLMSDSTFTMGAQLSTWGFPEGYGGLIPLLTIGYLAGVDEHHLKPNVVLRKWIVNGAFNRGNSGGPVLETKTARVVGVISSKLAPMPKDLESNLQNLEKNGSVEGQIIAKVLQHLRSQTQLVIGFATMSKDLRKFLQTNGVEP